MTISQKIFKLLELEKLSQKDFSEKTGIPQSTISDWRKKNTNPASDKILIICEVLKVTPYELLSGVEEEGQQKQKTKMQNYCGNIRRKSSSGNVWKVGSRPEESIVRVS